MAFLTPDKIRIEHGLEIKEKIIPWGAVWPKDSGSFKKGDLYKADRKLSGGTGKVEYVTIHNTDDILEAKGTNDAEQYARATWPNANMGDARVHYFIDETDCWQQLREDEVGWHAGDGRGPGNDSSLAIEIIMDGSGSAADKGAEERGALLAAILLNKHGLGIDRLKTHKEWSGKYCPLYILPRWSAFKTKVENYLKQVNGSIAEKAETPEKAEPSGTIYRVQVGAFSKKANAELKRQAVEAAGFDAFVVNVDNKIWRVQVGAFSVKANADRMLSKLNAAGFSGFITKLSGKAEAAPSKKTVDELAREVIAGKHGSGDARKKSLGDQYEAVQKRVNELLK